MQDVSKEWLDFRRNQFPAGSRIQTWELDDPRNTLKEARKLDYIDDSGRFHVRQSDGGECVLTLGEEMFSVHPPESTQLKLYMPLTASFYARNEWGDWDETGEEWDGRTLLDYEDRILGSWCGTGCRRRRGGASCSGATRSSWTSRCAPPCLRQRPEAAGCGAWRSARSSASSLRRS
ncbi:MAG: DUF4314 domain-containing protein [Flavonifractor plautii]